MTPCRIGVLGGSGIYRMAGIEAPEEITVETPFGPPSAVLRVGSIGQARVAFLPRHGVGHRLLPGEVNARANIFALASLGVRWLVSVSAVGSMKESYAPGDVVIIDQFIDLTRHRHSTFFGDGAVGHIPFADPICGQLANLLAQAADDCGARAHRGGTYLCIEGPQFSTRAESRLYRGWGVDVIGMTNAPEAKLAREAGISYATLALVTDYDCWHEAHDDVAVDDVLEVLKQNAGLAERIVVNLAGRIDPNARSPHEGCGKRAVVTDPAQLSDDTRRRLRFILEP